jgi:LacI family transcriptional regulator
MMRRKKTKARIIDIALEAGVSTATVDRVLNKRHGVRPVTVERVWAAAARLDASPTAAPRRPRGRGELRFDFILPAGAGPSIDDNLHQAAERAGRRLGAAIRFQHFERSQPATLAEAIARCGRETSSGVAVMALEHPLVREAVERLAQMGVPVVALLSDLSSSRRVGYAGIDNRAAGRTAGYLLGRFLGGRSGKVAILAGNPLYRSHEEREMGFRSVLRADFRELEVLDPVVGHDAPEANRQHVLALLARHDDLIGIYSIGSGNRGVVQALQERGKAGEVTFIAHNLTALSRQYLLEGAADAIIHQDMVRIAERALAMLLAHHGSPAPETGLLPVEIVVRENIVT